MLHFAKARRQSTGGGNANALNRYPPISVPMVALCRKRYDIPKTWYNSGNTGSHRFFFFFLFLSLFFSLSSSSSFSSFLFLTIISVLPVPSSFVELRSVACNKKLLEGKNFPVKKTP